MALLIADLILVLNAMFTQIANVFTLVTSNPILLIAVGLTLFGVVLKFGKKMLRL